MKRPATRISQLPTKEDVSFRRRRNLGIEDAQPRDASFLGMTRFLHAAVARRGTRTAPPSPTAGLVGSAAHPYDQHESWQTPSDGSPP